MNMYIIYVSQTDCIVFLYPFASYNVAVKNKQWIKYVPDRNLYFERYDRLNPLDVIPCHGLNLVNNITNMFLLTNYLTIKRNYIQYFMLFAFRSKYVLYQKYNMLQYVYKRYCQQRLQSKKITMSSKEISKKGIYFSIGSWLISIKCQCRIEKLFLNVN